jgi:hypothetical protein
MGLIQSIESPWEYCSGTWKKKMKKNSLLCTADSAQADELSVCPFWWPTDLKLSQLSLNQFLATNLLI